MYRLCFVLFLSILTINSFAGGITRSIAPGEQLADTTKPLNSFLSSIKTGNSDVLVVINDKIMGTLSEMKKSIDKLVSADSIERLNVLKDTLGWVKYGDKGKNGVIEIFLKKPPVKITDVTITDIKQEGQDILIEKPEFEAAFPGGDAGWMKFLKKNVNGMVATDNGAPTGTYVVVVQFIVDKNGEISDIKALTNHGYGMEKEIVKALKKSPNWLPAVLHGKQVKAYRKQPVIFTVANE